MHDENDYKHQKEELNWRFFNSRLVQTRMVCLSEIYPKAEWQYNEELAHARRAH